MKNCLLLAGIIVAAMALGCKPIPLVSPVHTLTPPVHAQQPALPPNPAVGTAQERVNQIGYKLVAANNDLIQQLSPTWTVVPGETPTLRFEGERTYLTEGLVRACTTEGQLAAMLSWTVGQTYSARQTRLTENAASVAVAPPETFRVGNDGSGFNEADPMFQAQYQREVELQKKRRLAQQPPPDPLVVARQVLAQGGYSVHELESMQPLLGQLPTAQ